MKINWPNIIKKVVAVVVIAVALIWSDNYFRNVGIVWHILGKSAILFIALMSIEYLGLLKK